MNTRHTGDDMKTFSEILQDRGCDKGSADIAAAVIKREIAGETTPDNRTQPERDAILKAWSQLDVVIADYGR